MKEIKKIENFTTFTSSVSDGSKVKIVRDDAGNELGFEVSGMVTTFDAANENGYVFTKGSYDRFVDDYFVSHSLNVPVCLLHNDTDIRNLCGFVKTMTKTDSGVEMTAFIPKCAYYYNLIKAQIECGILQGFSNAGGVVSGHYNEEKDELEISGFALQHVALVATPADTTATFVTNTTFSGFDETKKEEPKKETNDDWRDIV